MPSIQTLLENNRAWARSVNAEDPTFFERLSSQQSPGYLWIGCADSRVPSTQLTGLVPGEMFVHRNVANVVVHADLNCLSVIQYAVEVLKVEHIIVCGHYGCGGVEAALRDSQFGLIDNWLRHVQDVHNKHRTFIESAGDFPARLARLCELNVIEQVVNVAQTTIVRQAWERGQQLTVNGLIYGLDDGLLRDLQMRVNSAKSLTAQFKQAIDNLGKKK
ncbi:MAG: carbonate dehydratase [Chloroflexi bacterium HGW-Chloroflexi-6]|nr:MAG: carbonate dehydratase [Chloroflexi bacterium HGW-Chloroflexi-6]